MTRQLRMLRLLLAGLVAGAPIVRAIPHVTSVVAPVSVAAVSVAVSDVAQAAVVLDGSDDRADLGTLPGWGDNMEGSWTVMAWINTTQTGCASLFPVYSQNSSTGDAQTHWIMFPCGHNGSSLVNNDDHIVINQGDCADEGFLWQKELANTAVNDGNWHHVALSATTPSVAASRVLNLYIDGVLDTGSWTKTFDGTYAGSCGGNQFKDLTSTAPLGARKITTGCPGACQYFDFLTGSIEDARLYTRALAAYEIAAIVVGVGRDGINDGLRRWDFTVDCRDLSANGTSCTLQNGAAIGSSNGVIRGVRRR